MADRDPLSGLTELARLGEDPAQPLPVEQVRRLGDRRRTRRHAGMVAAAVGLVMIAGGTALSQGVLDTDRSPDPAHTPTTVPAVVTASPAPARTVTAVNLIKASEVPDSIRSGSSRPGRRRPECGSSDHLRTGRGDGPARRDSHARPKLPDGSALRRLDEPAGEADPQRPHPLHASPAVRLDAAAEKAYLTYRDWLDGCSQTIKDRGDTAFGGGGWTSVSTSINGAKAGFEEFVWQDASDRPDQGISSRSG